MIYDDDLNLLLLLWPLQWNEWQHLSELMPHSENKCEQQSLAIRQDANESNKRIVLTFRIRMQSLNENKKFKTVFFKLTYMSLCIGGNFSCVM